ncbi:MAG: hypothetical protein HQK98_08530 [Nitrospirae bacterium]|nr:hypothetical protein [Nitrospirota bacterium]
MIVVMTVENTLILGIEHRKRRQKNGIFFRIGKCCQTVSHLAGQAQYPISMQSGLGGVCLDKGRTYLVVCDMRLFEYGVISLRMVILYLGFVLIFIGFYFIWDKYLGKNTRVKRFADKTHDFVEKDGFLFLLLFIVLSLCWFFIVLFQNPYMEVYNYGDANIFVQMSSNVSRGIGPETSWSMPSFGTNYGSIFLQRLYITPLLLLAPLYAIYPHPPMHIYDILIIVYIIGCPGVYIFVRKTGGSKTVALMGAVGYMILPQTQISLFNKGIFDIVGLAILPYVFLTMIDRRWGWFCFVSVVFALMNTPQSYYVMFIGVFIFFLIKDRRAGLAAFLIGLLIAKWGVLVAQYAACIGFDDNGSGVGLSSGVMSFVLGYSSLKDHMVFLIKNGVVFYAEYILLLLIILCFLPILSLRKNKEWNMGIIVLLLMSLVGVSLNLIRFYHWGSHRNYFVFVPIYMASLKAMTDIRKSESSYFSKNIAIVFFLSVFTFSFFGPTMYPWQVSHKFFDYHQEVGSDSLSLEHLVTKTGRTWLLNDVIRNINLYVPQNASIAFSVADMFETFMTNRQHTWSIGAHPEGVEYFVMTEGTKSRYLLDPALYTKFGAFYWNYRSSIEAHKGDFTLLYRDDVITILKNNNAKPITRNGKYLGWDVLWKAVLRKGCD